jgi:hypothetical protein
MLSALTRSLGSGWCILQAGDLGVFQRLLLDEETLAFVALPRTTPLQDNGPESGCLLGTSGQSRISCRKKLQVIEVGTRKTERAFGLVKLDPS